MDKDPLDVLAKILELMGGGNAAASAMMAGHMVDLNGKLYLAVPKEMNREKFDKEVLPVIRKDIGSADLHVLDFPNALEDHEDRYEIGEKMGEVIQELELNARRVNVSYTPVGFIAHFNGKVPSESVEQLTNAFLDILNDYNGKLRLITVVGKDVKIFTDLGGGASRKTEPEATQESDGNREINDPARLRGFPISDAHIIDIKLAINSPDVLQAIEALSVIGTRDRY